MEIRSADFRPHIQEVKYLLDTCIIAAILNQEQGHRHLEDRIVAAPRGSLHVSAMDPLIAAQAIAVGAVCVTDNMRHFLRIPGLTIENWLRAA